MESIQVETYLGERISADSWEGILHFLKVTNFSKPEDLQELMTRLRHRIKVFSGDVINVGTYEEFGHELERVGFLKIIREVNDDSDTTAN